MAAILVLQINPVGVKHFSYVKYFFYFNKFAKMMKTSVKTLYEKITKAAQYRCWTPIGDKHLNESWNWFAAKSSIQGLALLVQ